MVVFFWGALQGMDESLEKALLDMEARDQAVRAELTAAGDLDNHYHPKLAEIHRANSSRLRQMIAVFGWPGLRLVGDQGARAAWRIALHSIGEPAFMRQCRDLIDSASQHDDAPRWQFAIIDDRIRVYEGRPQRYGTQLRVGPQGLEPYPLENESRVNSMRMQAGLPPLAQTLAQARAQPQPSKDAQAARDQADVEFRKSVGWIS
jgi:uncharacterized protein DUF6624